MTLHNEYFHQENIENILPKPPEPIAPKKIRFQSKYHNQVADEFSSGKKPHLTMGEAETSLSPRSSS